MALKLKEIMKKIYEFEKNVITAQELKGYIEKEIKPVRFLSTIDKGKLAKQVYEKYSTRNLPNGDASTYAIDVYSYLSAITLFAYGDISYAKNDNLIKAYDRFCAYGIKDYIYSFSNRDHEDVFGMFETMIRFDFNYIMYKNTSPENIKRIDDTVEKFKDILVNKHGIEMVDAYMKANNT